MNTEIVLAVTCGVVHFAKHAHMSVTQCEWRKIVVVVGAKVVVALEGLIQENDKGSLREKTFVIVVEKNEEDDYRHD